MQKVKIVQPGKRYNGQPLDVGAVVEMEEPRARDWIARGWAGSLDQNLPGGQSASRTAPARVTRSVDSKELKRLARKYRIDTKGMSPEDLQAAVELAEEEAGGKEEAGDSDERESEADGETSGGDGDEEPA